MIANGIVRRAFLASSPKFKRSGMCAIIKSNLQTLTGRRDHIETDKRKKACRRTGHNTRPAERCKSTRTTMRVIAIGSDRHRLTPIIEICH